MVRPGLPRFASRAFIILAISLASGESTSGAASRSLMFWCPEKLLRSMRRLSTRLNILVLSRSVDTGFGRYASAPVFRPSMVSFSSDLQERSITGIWLMLMFCLTLAQSSIPPIWGITTSLTIMSGFDESASDRASAPSDASIMRKSALSSAARYDRSSASSSARSTRIFVLGLEARAFSVSTLSGIRGARPASVVSVTGAAGAASDAHTAEASAGCVSGMVTMKLAPLPEGLFSAWIFP